MHARTHAHTHTLRHTCTCSNDPPTGPLITTWLGCCRIQPRMHCFSPQPLGHWSHVTLCVCLYVVLHYYWAYRMCGNVWLCVCVYTLSFACESNLELIKSNHLRIDLMWWKTHWLTRKLSLQGSEHNQILWLRSSIKIECCSSWLSKNQTGPIKAVLFSDSLSQEVKDICSPQYFEKRDKIIHYLTER